MLGDSSRNIKKTGPDLYAYVLDVVRRLVYAENWKVEFFFGSGWDDYSEPGGTIFPGNKMCRRHAMENTGSVCMCAVTLQLYEE